VSTVHHGRPTAARRGQWQGRRRATGGASRTPFAKGRQDARTPRDPRTSSCAADAPIVLQAKFGRRLGGASFLIPLADGLRVHGCGRSPQALLAAFDGPSACDVNSSIRRPCRPCPAAAAARDAIERACEASSVRMGSVVCAAWLPSGRSARSGPACPPFSGSVCGSLCPSCASAVNLPSERHERLSRGQRAWQLAADG
jgi:hypothetical protein